MITSTKTKAAAGLLAIAAVVGAGTLVTVGRGAALARPGPSVPADSGRAAAAAADLREKAAARVNAAEQLVQHIDARVQAGEAMTPTFVDLRMTALRRLAEARVDAAENRGAAVQAAEQYVEQIRAAVGILRKRFEAGVDVSRLQVSQAQYQLADAEYFLAKLRAGE